MDDRYREIFRDIYTGYRSLYTERNMGQLPLAEENGVGTVAAAIADAIGSADAELRDQRELALRPDAAVLLLVNAMALAAQPLARGRDATSAELASEISDDVKTIVHEAASEVRDEREVSGRAVILAVGKTWGTLKTAARHAWD